MEKFRDLGGNLAHIQYLALKVILESHVFDAFIALVRCFFVIMATTRLSPLLPIIWYDNDLARLAFPRRELLAHASSFPSPARLAVVVIPSKVYCRHRLVCKSSPWTGCAMPAASPSASPWSTLRSLQPRLCSSAASPMESSGPEGTPWS